MNMSWLLPVVSDNEPKVAVLAKFPVAHTTPVSQEAIALPST